MQESGFSFGLLHASSTEQPCLGAGTGWSGHELKLCKPYVCGQAPPAGGQAGQHENTKASRTLSAGSNAMYAFRVFARSTMPFERATKSAKTEPCWEQPAYHLRPIFNCRCCSTSLSLCRKYELRLQTRTDAQRDQKSRS